MEPPDVNDLLANAERMMKSIQEDIEEIRICNEQMTDILRIQLRREMKAQMLLENVQELFQFLQCLRRASNKGGKGKAAAMGPISEDSDTPHEDTGHAHGSSRWDSRYVLGLKSAGKGNFRRLSPPPPPTGPESAPRSLKIEKNQSSPRYNPPTDLSATCGGSVPRSSPNVHFAHDPMGKLTQHMRLSADPYQHHPPQRPATDNRHPQQTSAGELKHEGGSNTGFATTAEMLEAFRSYKNLKDRGLDRHETGKGGSQDTSGRGSPVGIDLTAASSQEQEGEEPQGITGPSSNTATKPAGPSILPASRPTAAPAPPPRPPAQLNRPATSRGAHGTSAASHIYIFSSSDGDTKPGTGAKDLRPTGRFQGGDGGSGSAGSALGPPPRARKKSEPPASHPENWEEVDRHSSDSEPVAHFRRRVKRQRK